jgi:hypothetical protein
LIWVKNQWLWEGKITNGNTNLAYMDGKRGSHNWYSDRKQTTVIEFDSQAEMENTQQ